MIARPYAGILGLLAFSTVVLRCLLLGGSLENAIQSAILGMIVFSLIGFTIGKIAERTVDESVRGKLLASTDENVDGAATPDV